MGLFERYRVLGLVCDGGPSGACRSRLYSLGGASFLVCPVNRGQTIHVYDVEHLRLIGAAEVCTGTESLADIAAVGERTFLAVDTGVLVYDRLKKVDAWQLHEDNISFLCLFGDHVVSVSAAEHRLVVWSSRGDVVSDLYLQPDFQPTAAVHPATYLNKVLLGSADGRLQLWNIRTKTQIYEFAGLGAAVSVLEQSPVTDVVAIGLDNGVIVLHNLRFDETVLRFRHDDGLRVTALSFRGDGDESLISACANGDVAVWDLNERRLRMTNRDVHHEGVASAAFVQGEPLLVTTGMHDNSVKVHLFDVPDGSARVLRSRSGHRAPPTRVRFCGSDGRQLVSAGLDRELRIVSTIRDAANRVISQGALKKKKRRMNPSIVQGMSYQTMTRSEMTRLPPVVDMAVGAQRRGDEDFANIVTAHSGVKGAYTWRMESGALARHVLEPPQSTQGGAGGAMGADDDKFTTCTAVQISPAGHIAYVGRSDGGMHAYNLQSGRHIALSDAQHQARVTALAVDALGEQLVSGSDDRSLIFLDAHTMKQSGEPIDVGAATEHLCWSPDSDLIGAACEDLVVRVYDAETRKLARRLRGHNLRITDMCFAPGGRWLLTASIDSTVRTWDLLSGLEIDRLDCPSPPSSIAFSPEAAFIATTHIAELGIWLWVNRAHFGAGPSRVAGALSYDDPLADTKAADMPCADNVVTLSSVPVSQWIVLANLKEIRERNKPQAPVQKPQAAPFFLPTVKGLNPGFDMTDDQANGPRGKRSVKLKDVGSLFELSRFGSLCVAGKHDEALDLMKSLGPSGVDLQMRGVEGQEALHAVVKYFNYAVTSRREFDLVEAHLGLFLKVHGAEIAGDSSCLAELKDLRRAHDESWRRLRESFSVVTTLSAQFSGKQ